MNLSQVKLFVRRNMKTKVKVYRDMQSKYNRSIQRVSQINENVLLAGMTGKSSCDKLLGKDNEGSLHYELKPLLTAKRWLGCFPVYFSKAGKYIHTHTHTYPYV
jgi:hypothetical protein